MIWECHTLTTNPGDTLSPQGSTRLGIKAWRAARLPSLRLPYVRTLWPLHSPGQQTSFYLPSSMKARTFHARLGEVVFDRKMLFTGSPRMELPSAGQELGKAFDTTHINTGPAGMHRYS